MVINRDINQIRKRARRNSSMDEQKASGSEQKVAQAETTESAASEAPADQDALAALPVMFSVGDTLTHKDGTVGTVIKSQYTDDKNPWRGYYYHVTYSANASTIQDVWHVTDLKLAVELPESAYAHKEAAGQMLQAGLAADRGHDADEMQALKDANAALQRANDGLLKTNRQQSDMLKKAREETALARAAQDKLKDRVRELEAAMQGERRIEIKTLTRCFAHNAAGEEDAKLATYLNNGWDIKSTDETVIKKDSDSRYWHYQTVLLTREVGGDQPDPQTTRTGRRFERQADSPLPSLRGAQTDEKPPEAGAFQAALRAGAPVRELTALGNKLALAAGEREYRARTAHIRQPERLGTG